MKANFVTKFLSIIFLSFLLFSVGYGKISKDYYDAIFDGCMEESLKISNNYDLSKKYCTCTSGHFNDNYNDDSLIKLVESEGGSAYNDVVNYVSGICNKKIGKG